MNIGVIYLELVGEPGWENQQRLSYEQLRLEQLRGMLRSGEEYGRKEARGRDINTSATC